MSPTPISKFILEDREFLVKRDDLVDPFLAGNKFRKLHTLLNTPNKTYSTIISYGGTQSNAMLAIARMCQQKDWNFHYYSKPISQTQKDEDSGNFYMAKELGMKHFEIDAELYRDFIASLSLTIDKKTFLIDQGGAIDEATEGLEVLASEIKEQNPDVKVLCTPSGTGTTALFLAKSLPEYTVYTIPCVGDEEYLKVQMLCLVDKLPKNLLILKPKKKYHFAKPYKEFYEIYLKTKNAGIEFDLLYAPSMWESILEQTKDKVLYIHSGGVSGNSSMLKRYVKKGIC